MRWDKKMKNEFMSCRWMATMTKVKEERKQRKESKEGSRGRKGNEGRKEVRKEKKWEINRRKKSRDVIKFIFVCSPNYHFLHYYYRTVWEAINVCWNTVCEHP